MSRPSHLRTHMDGGIAVVRIRHGGMIVSGLMGHRFASTVIEVPANDNDPFHSVA